MWVEKQKNGKFKFVEQFKDEMTGKDKRVSVVMEKDTAATRRNALEELNRKIGVLQSLVVAKDVTLETLVAKYRVDQSKTVRKSTYVRNFHACNTLMNILGKDVLVNKLTAAYIKERFLETNKEPGTLNEHRTRLKALLNWGFENDYINDVSFLKKLKPFNDIPHKEKIQDKFLESSEVTSLLNHIAATDNWCWWYVTKFMVLSGLRFGEIAALDSHDVDTTENVIHVSKTYDSVNCVTGPPKTLCSIRDVYMQEDLVKLAKKINAYMLRQSLEHNYTSDFSLYFCSKSGEHIAYYAYNKYLRETSTKVLGRSITTHVLRHTHASLLLEQGVDIDTISRRLGHENSVVTREIYLHVTKKLKNRDNEQLANLKII
ncbi:MAG: site-specific integrase [Lachnospiraceae bacterium]|nr:site-specific integrase [Lachnospiraceae bacterium]